MKRFFISFSFSLFLTFSFFAQESTKSVAHNSKGWSSAFQEKTFVQNMGQFPVFGKDSVLFYTTIKHGFIYFTNDGYGYVQGENEMRGPRKRKKKDDHPLPTPTGSKKKMTRTQWVKFKNASVSASVSGMEIQSNYHTNEKVLGVKIPVYKKIKYTNVYPNIDFVFELTTQEEGLKYDIVVRPGGDPNDIGIEYKKANTIRVDSLGQVVIDSKFGTFTESIPESFIEKTKKPVLVNFEVNNGLIQFSCGRYPKRETLIIDPFVTNSVFTTPVYPPFEIDYDFAGNVYVSSFEPQVIFVPPGQIFPVIVDEKVTIKKFSPTGALLWTNLKDDMDADFGHEYPFTVNRSTQEVFGHAARSDMPAALMRKISPAGVTTDSLSIGTFLMGSAPLIVEVFTMEYDHCNDKILLGSGADLHAMSIDPSFSGAGIISDSLLPLSGQTVRGVDCIMIRFDPYEDTMAYMVFCQVDPVSPTAPLSPTASQITKTTSGVSGFDWSNTTIHPFFEAFSFMIFGVDTIYMGNHFNGVSPGLNYTFVYDTDSISVYNKTTGALVQIGNIVSPVSYSIVPQNPASPNLSKNVYFNSMGIAVDVCDNVYVAVGDTIKCYDFNLNFLDQFAAGGVVTDLRYGDNNILYASGDNFVQAIDPEIAFPNVHPLFSFVVTPDSCSTGIGAISIIGCPNLDSLDITWSLGGQKTKDISALNTGWYSVSITADSIMSCNGFSYTFTDSVFVPDVIANCNLNISLSNQTICEGDSVLLQAIYSGNSGPVSFQWDNGISVVTDTVSVFPMVSTVYTVIITDSAGFRDTASATVTVLQSPSFSLGNDTTLCSSLSLLLSTGISGVSHTWSTGDTGSTLAVSTSGNYWVEVNNGGCTFSDTISVTFLPNPLDLGGDTLLCQVTTLLLDATAVGFTYLWDDGSIAPTKSVSTTGTYFVTISDGVCTFSDTIEVVMLEIGIALGNDTTLCPNETLVIVPTLSGISSGTVLWSTGISAPTLSVTAAATIWGQVDTAGCIARDSIVVDYVPLTVNIGPDTILCSTTSLVLDAQNSGATYQWSTGQTTQSITVTSAGTFSVLVDNQGCIVTDSIQVSFQNVTADFSAIPLTGCAPLFVNFSDNSTSSGAITNRNWSYGDGTTSTLISSSHTYSTAGTYSVSLEVTSTLGCKDTLVRLSYITAYAQAQASFTYLPLLPETGAEVSFSNLSVNSSSWKWLFGDGDSTTVSNPTHRYLSEGTYTVTLIAISPDGCNDTIEFQLNIQNSRVMYAPNSFTPNKDDLNDTWKVSGIEEYTSFSLIIFNRWGEKIFESTDPDEGWDGTYLGEPVPIDVYVWKGVLNTPKEGAVEIGGHINVIR